MLTMLLAFVIWTGYSSVEIVLSAPNDWSSLLKAPWLSWHSTSILMETKRGCRLPARTRCFGRSPLSEDLSEQKT
jgi:hypothetical protein